MNNKAIYLNTQNTQYFIDQLNSLFWVLYGR